jgi:hypothetical protein
MELAIFGRLLGGRCKGRSGGRVVVDVRCAGPKCILRSHDLRTNIEICSIQELQRMWVRANGCDDDDDDDDVVHFIVRLQP